MSTTLGIVEVPRFQSAGIQSAGIQSAGTRTEGFPPSLAGHRFGNKSLLDWVVRRVTESLLLDQVVIVTDEEQAEEILRLAPPDVEVFVGAQPDALGCVAAATRHFQADQLVRVSLCCPFVDPELIDRLVCTAGGHGEFDYIGYFSIDGRPAVQSKAGLFGEWCSGKAVLRANALARSKSDRANSLQFIFTHPELSQLRFIPIPEKLDRSDVRLAIETAEDWDNAHLIFEALGPERLDWRRIVELLDHQPALRERMATLNEATV
jgi:spore coat polysaccharide biosynthesis protein SpsF (cytidylyltransferase family)